MQRQMNREERLHTAETNKQLIDTSAKLEILEQANVSFDMRSSIKMSRQTQKLLDVQTMINETKITRINLKQSQLAFNNEILVELQR